MSKTTRHWIGILVLWNLLQTIPISSISTDIGRHLFDHAYHLRAYDYKRIAHVENYLSASNADYLTNRETKSLNRYCESDKKLDQFSIEWVKKSNYLSDRVKKSILEKCG